MPIYSIISKYNLKEDKELLILLSQYLAMLTNGTAALCNMVTSEEVL